MDLLRKGADNQMQKSAVRQEFLQLCENAVRNGRCCASKISIDQETQCSKQFGFGLLVFKLLGFYPIWLRFVAVRQAAFV